VYVWVIVTVVESPKGRVVHVPYIHLAEVIAVGLSMAKTLGWGEGARLGFAFQWTKLRGRILEPWTQPMTPISAWDQAHMDTVESYTEVPIETSLTAIAPYVSEATHDLFVLFGGWSMPREATE